MRLCPVVPALLVLMIASVPLEAQQRGCWTVWEPVGGAYRDLERSLSLVDGEPPVSGALRRMGWAQMRECTPLAGAAQRSGGDVWSFGVPDVTLLPAATVIQDNSGYPRPQVDGLRWAGRGLSGAATAGVAARWGPISAAIAPVTAYQANAEYEIQTAMLSGHSEYGSYYHAGSIDWPQRFGDDELHWFHLGQSFVRLDAFGAAVGFSTENLRWGPVRRNPLLMGAAGPGFAHAFIGTSEPLDVRLGHLELEAVWGRLQESEFFDTIPANDARLLAGLVVAFTPASTGLTVGLARSYVRYWPEGLGLGEVIAGPYTNVRSNPGRFSSDADNQLLSAFFRWALPESDFEVYGEYAREDHWHDLEDLIQEPDHERAYAVGLQKMFGDAASEHRYRVAAEATILNSSWTGPYRGGGRGDFYTHTQVRQGYTHRGQPLGAPTGTGSDAQYVAFDYLGRTALGGVYVERVRYDNNVYYDVFAGSYTSGGHDAEVTVGLRGGLTASWPVPGLQLVGDVGYSSRYNRGFVGLQGGVHPTHETNLSLSLGAAWTPVRTARPGS